MRRSAVAIVVACAALGAACSLMTDLNGLSDGPSDAGAGADAAIDASGDATASPPQASWRYRKALTVDGARVRGSSELKDFPLLVSTTDGDLKAVANGGKVVTGADIAFFAADGVTPLAFEIERYSAVTGQLVAWVALPALSPVTGTKIYLAFGNPDAKTSLGSRTAVWNDGYVGVWHMGDAAWDDSTKSRAAKAVGGAAPAADGMIAGGGVFGATNVYVDVGADPDLRPKSITVSTWAKAASVGSLPDRHPYMVHQDSWRADDADPRGYYLEIYRTQTNPSPTFYTANATTKAHAFATTDVVNGTWYYVVGTHDESSGRTKIYVDGVEEGSATMTGGIAYLDNIVRLGGIGEQTWDGMLDEVRISRVVRSDGWIRTEHDNQRSPQTFVTVGALEATQP